MSQSSQPKSSESTAPFEYHQEIELEISTLTNLGLGLGRINGWVVMVPFTLPGEKVRAKVFRNRPNYSDADLIEVLVPSPHRIQAQCRLFTVCGGCQYQHLEYDQQLIWKRQHVIDSFERIGGITASFNPTIGSPKTSGYRSKLTPHYQRPKDGELGPIGFLRYGNRQRLVDVPSCPIAMDGINEALPKVRSDLAKRASQSKMRRGGTLLLRTSISGTTSKHDEVIEEKVGDIRFRFLAGDFFQNNPFILEKLVEFIRSRMNDGKTPYLVDTYCGSGLFSLTLADVFAEVEGIEISESAIQWAKDNAELNEIDNARFRAGDAAALFQEVKFPADQTTVLLDPPRKGTTDSFLEQLVGFGPQRILYVSCEPSTQARDIKKILEQGYSIVEIQPFDLFPQTRHVENVVILERDKGTIN